MDSSRTSNFGKTKAQTSNRVKATSADRATALRPRCARVQKYVCCVTFRHHSRPVALCEVGGYGRSAHRISTVLETNRSEQEPQHSHRAQFEPFFRGKVHPRKVLFFNSPSRRDREPDRRGLLMSPKVHLSALKASDVEKRLEGVADL